MEGSLHMRVPLGGKDQCSAAATSAGPQPPPLQIRRRRIGLQIRRRRIGYEALHAAIMHRRRASTTASAQVGSSPNPHLRAPQPRVLWAARPRALPR